MEEIFKISTDDWKQGISTSEYNGPVLSTETGGFSAAGLLDSSDNKYYRGLLSGQPPSNTYSPPGGDFALASTEVVDQNSPFNKKFYYIGSGGHLYSLKAKDDGTNNITDHRSGTQISDPANGIATFQPQGGTKYLYYAQNNQIGRWDLSGSYPTGWTDDWQTGVETTIEKPMHRFFDNLYFGNKNTIGRIGDDGNGGVTFQSDVLDFSSDFEVKTMTNDGRYLVIGITDRRNITGGTSTDTGTGKSRVLFWDTNSDSWNKEWDVPGSQGIVSMRAVNNKVFILDQAGLYITSYNNSPELVVDGTAGIGTGVFRSDGGSSEVYNNDQMTVFRQGVIWKDTKKVAFYGKPYPDFEEGLHILHDNVGAFSDTFLGVGGGSDPEIWLTGNSVNVLPYSSVSGNGSTHMETRFIDMQDRYDVSKIETVFGKSTTFDVTVTVKAIDRNLDETTLGSFDVADSSAKPEEEIYINADWRTSHMKLRYEFDTDEGASIKAIRVHGDKLD